jgi:hypothetical protein
MLEHPALTQPVFVFLQGSYDSKAARGWHCQLPRRSVARKLRPQPMYRLRGISDCDSPTGIHFRTADNTGANTHCDKAQIHRPMSAAGNALVLFDRHSRHAADDATTE